MVKKYLGLNNPGTFRASLKRRSINELTIFELLLYRSKRGKSEGAKSREYGGLGAFKSPFRNFVF